MNIVLSSRMTANASLVKEHGILADIGTDHAYLPLYLVKQGHNSGAIAMDVNKGPLERADGHIHIEGLADKITTRLSDGADKLQDGEAESIVIAGMGGALTEKILTEAGSTVKGAKELILQPQSEIYKVRIWLRENGWVIDDEDMVLEDGKYYPMMHAVRADAANVDAANTSDTSNADAAAGTFAEMGDAAGENDADYLRHLGDVYGPVLLKKRHPVLKSYLEFEQRVQERIADSLPASDSDSAKARRAEVEETLHRNREAQLIVAREV